MAGQAESDAAGSKLEHVTRRSYLCDASFRNEYRRNFSISSEDLRLPCVAGHRAEILVMYLFVTRTITHALTEYFDESGGSGLPDVCWPLTAIRLKLVIGESSDCVSGTTAMWR